MKKWNIWLKTCGTILTIVLPIVTLYYTIKPPISPDKIQLDEFEVVLFNNTDTTLNYIMNSSAYSLSPYSKKKHKDKNGDFWINFKNDLFNDLSETRNIKLTYKISYEFYWNNELIDIQPTKD